MNILASIGLVADIIGVLFLFKYGLPSKIKEHGGGLLIEESNDKVQARIKENRKIETRAYWGLSLILLGFVFQLVGTNISCFVK